MSVNTETQGVSTKLVAFHLPQFYPTPYNDEWWGKGFTEWTNVTKARPRFRGHYQPHLPADLGFYDLRLPEAREAQAALASQYGIYGFCYYHYWFNGKRVLERPVDEILRLGTPNFPFCLCWANDNWTRAWDGANKQVLLQQAYSDEDDLNHIRWLAHVFNDPRYIRVQGKPLFLIYRSQHLPSPQKTTDRWREEARRLGIGELHLCRVENNYDDDTPTDPRSLGFDAAVEFQPKVRLLRHRLPQRAMQRFFPHATNHRFHPYSELVSHALSAPAVTYPRYPGVCPSWDNSARLKRKAWALTNSSPDQYERWLREVIRRAQIQQGNDKIVFINAWNEWAEGCHLEPCQKWGRQYLEATYKALHPST